MKVFQCPRVDHISLFTQVEKESNQQNPKSITEEVLEMSLAERVGQMVLAGISGTELDKDSKSLINQYHVGGIIFYKDNFKTKRQAVKPTNQIKTENNSKIPLFLGVDQEGGPITRLPNMSADLPSINILDK